MSNKHIFISYSRVDGDFAHKLAEDLRAQGVNIWLDKIDIPVGARWDRAVEEALETCGRLLLVMSPTSVSSENVMDEISEAFQNEKPIIPIMHQKCDVPMRIRRLQYIDFTEDYDSALKRLIGVLGQDVPVSPPAPTREEPVPPAPAPILGRRNMIVGIGATLVMLIALIGYWALKGDPPGEEATAQPVAAGSDASQPDVDAVLDCRDVENLKAPADTSIAATIKFTNHRDQEIIIYKVDTSGKWIEEGKLAPSGEQTFETHAGEIWQVADSADNCLGIYKMGADQNHVEVK